MRKRDPSDNHAHTKSDSVQHRTLHRTHFIPKQNMSDTGKNSISSDDVEELERSNTPANTGSKMGVKEAKEAREAAAARVAAAATAGAATS